MRTALLACVLIVGGCDCGGGGSLGPDDGLSGDAAPASDAAEPDDASRSPDAAEPSDASHQADADTQRDARTAGTLTVTAEAGASCGGLLRIAGEVSVEQGLPSVRAVGDAFDFPLVVASTGRFDEQVDVGDARSLKIVAT